LGCKVEIVNSYPVVVQGQDSSVVPKASDETDVQLVPTGLRIFSENGPGHNACFCVPLTNDTDTVSRAVSWEDLRAYPEIL